MSPQPSPPRLARAILSAFLHPADRRFALADLEEEYEARVSQRGIGSSWIWYWSQALRSLGPALLDRKSRLASSILAAWGSGGGRIADLRGMAEVVHDLFGALSYASRSLAKAPLVTAVTVLSLGLGTGAVTATFSVLNQILFQPPIAISDPEGLVTLYTREPGGKPHGSSSFPDYLDMRNGLGALHDAAAISVRTVGLLDGERTRSLLAEEVTGNYFGVIGLQPFLGRGFVAGESAPHGAAPLTVLGYDLWQRDFAADPGIIGQTVHLDGQPHTVIGIAPEGFVSRRVPLKPEIWVPLGSLDRGRAGSERRIEQRDEHGFLVLGRLADGQTLGQLQAQADVLAARLGADHPDVWHDEQGRAQSLVAVSEQDSRVNPDARRLLGSVGIFFLVATGLVLLTACSNVASLFVARANQRAREMALRVALGASRRRLLGMLLTEGLLLGVASAGLALAVTVWVARVVGSASFDMAIPVRLSIDVDTRVYVFAILLSLASSLVAGLVPAALGSRPDLARVLKGGAEVVGSRRRRFGLRNGMVIVQCAASLVLLIGATLFIRSLNHASQMDLGMRPEGIAVASKTLDPRRYDPEAGVAYLRELRSRLQGRPGVERVAMSRGLELTLFQPNAPVELSVAGYEPVPGAPDAYHRNAVSSGYLELLGVPMLAGRTIRDDDDRSGPLVAVVNQAFAGRFWPGKDPIGRQFQMSDTRAPDHGEAAGMRTYTVVGLARDGKYIDFDDHALPYFWTSLDQDYATTVAVLAKGRFGAELVLPALREEIALEEGELQKDPPLVAREPRCDSVRPPSNRVESTRMGERLCAAPLSDRNLRDRFDRRVAADEGDGDPDGHRRPALRRGARRRPRRTRAGGLRPGGGCGRGAAPGEAGRERSRRRGSGRSPRFRHQRGGPATGRRRRERDSGAPCDATGSGPRAPARLGPHGPAQGTDPVRPREASVRASSLPCWVASNAAGVLAPPAEPSPVVLRRTQVRASSR